MLMVAKPPASWFPAMVRSPMSLRSFATMIADEYKDPSIREPEMVTFLPPTIWTPSLWVPSEWLLSS